MSTRRCISTTGATRATASGASTRELMALMGHASIRAALIHQHATAPRDRAIADALDRMMVDDLRVEAAQAGNDWARIGHEDSDSPAAGTTGPGQASV